MSDKYYWFDLILYEIWGNKKDGFWVNDAYVSERDIIISADIVEGTDDKIIQAIKRLGLINKGTHNKSIQIEGEPEHTLYFNDVRSCAGGFCPAFELRFVKTVG
jgi:hypothetical protein